MVDTCRMDVGGSLVGRGVSATALPAPDLPVTKGASGFAEFYAAEFRARFGVRRCSPVTPSSPMTWSTTPSSISIGAGTPWINLAHIWL